MSKNNSHPDKKSAQKALSLSRKEVSVTAQYHHSGPIPDPMTLERYEHILPGSANRILTMAEEQSLHRREMEQIVIRSRARDSLLGIIAGFLLALVTILSGTYVVIRGYAWSGTILGSAGLVGLVGVFIYGTRSARKERESMRQ